MQVVRRNGEMWVCQKSSNISTCNMHFFFEKLFFRTVAIQEDKVHIPWYTYLELSRFPSFQKKNRGSF